MQILESSVMGLRTARLSLRNPRSDVRITLFPMTHVGEPDFFQKVYADAFSHDVVLVEGVRSPIVRRITRSYRWIKGSKRMNLVIQSAFPSQANSHARIVHADLSGEEFAQLWRNVPLRVRAFVFVAAPLIGLRRRWFGTRTSLAKGQSLDDLPDRKEILRFHPETIALTEAVIHARDARLVARLGEELDNPTTGAQRLAIVYGAGHMRAVLRELLQRRGYRVEKGEWLTIFTT
jgi:hypothetical protein